MYVTNRYHILGHGLRLNFLTGQVIVNPDALMPHKYLDRTINQKGGGSLVEERSHRRLGSIIIL